VVIKLTRNIYRDYPRAGDREKIRINFLKMASTGLFLRTKIEKSAVIVRINRPNLRRISALIKASMRC